MPARVVHPRPSCMPSGSGNTLYLIISLAILSLFSIMRLQPTFLGLFPATFLHPKAGAGWTYGGNQGMLRQDSDIVSKAFPNIDVELMSPAFTDPSTLTPGWQNGTEGPTEDAVLDHFLRSIANRNDWASYQPADFQSEEGRSIPYIFLSSSTGFFMNSTKLRVYIQGGIHGDEPAGDQAILALLGKLDANQTWTASLLEWMDIEVLPRYNVDGVHYFQRRQASNLDANRDQLKMDSQQTRDLKKVFSNFDPHISIDMHEFIASKIYGGDYQHGADAMIAGGNNLNIYSNIREQIQNKWIPAIGRHLESNDLRWEMYAVGKMNFTSGSKIILEEAATDAAHGRNAMGLTQSITFLIEVRGMRLADQHFQRRVAAGLLSLEAILEHARDNFDEVLATVENARAEFVNSKDDIVVTDVSRFIERPFTMVDMNNGSIVQVPIDFYDTTPSTAKLTRTRPEAYLIPRTWISIAERLQILGLDVDILDYEFRGAVEAYNITSSSLATGITEGHVVNAVTTSALVKDVHLPAGSFLVRARQKNAALAFVTLEPENVDSYVSFSGIIPLNTGDEYPIYRVMAEHT
ncbi:hypothetical protein DOTSEDRAFT_89896 [Dothistroma septosporum NZE10]|uniref:Peptidase M14 domain-containing protein n=1 Tax=Dothistroma septosporum (strain NZE10 / CBS 128990) TaxID=675120 RepID=N1PMB7_DOTSN|nr:hypothetical protein DOTSEDRAFT_89896 [Dothistroma septosporum NZE10]